MSSGRPLEDVRAELRALEEPLVLALQERSRFRRDQPALARTLRSSPHSRLVAAYELEIVPYLSLPGDDGRHEECSAADERLFGLLGRRILLGGHIADAKMRREPERLAALVASGDRAALLTALTDAAVEAQVLERTRALAERHRGPSEASFLVEVFARWIIPLTKEVEVDSLLGGA